MFTVIVETRKDGEEHMGQKAFLARVESKQNGAIGYEYALEVVNYNNRRAFAMLAEPGQVFRTCRWRFNDENFIGGELWFAIDVSGAILSLEPREALALLSGRANADGETLDRLASLIRHRAAPVDVFCRRNDDSAVIPPKRPLDSVGRQRADALRRSATAITHVVIMATPTKGVRRACRHFRQTV